MAVIPSFARALVLGLVLLGGVVLSAPEDGFSQGATTHVESEYRGLWDRIFDPGVSCVAGTEFNDLFRVAATGGRGWSLYIPRGEATLARSAVGRVDRTVQGFWEKYHRLLGTAPGDGTRPVRIAVMNRHDVVGYGRNIVAGLTTSSCAREGSNMIYIFVPAAATISEQATVGHELFHAFQRKRTPASPRNRMHTEGWFVEATADWAAFSAIDRWPIAGHAAMGWNFPRAPLDSFESWNPGMLPMVVNGVNVRANRPYVFGAKFVAFLSQVFGVRPGSEFDEQAETQLFGAFLDRTFETFPDIESPISDRATSALFDQDVNDALLSREIRSRTTRALPNGLGDAYARFAVSRMFGHVPPPVSNLPDSDDRYFSWQNRESQSQTLEMSARLGLTVDAVEWGPPPAGAQQVILRSVGETPLAPEGRLFVQAGDRGVADDFSRGLEGAIDVSANARATGAGDASVGRSFLPMCLSHEFGRVNGLPLQSMWPNTGRLRLLLVNASMGSPGSHPVSVKIRFDFSSQPCPMPYQPRDQQRRQQKSDGSFQLCDGDERVPKDPNYPENPHDPAPDVWGKGSGACTYRDDAGPSEATIAPPLPEPDPAPYVAPPSEPPPYPSPISDIGNFGRPLRPTLSTFAMSGGLDCEQNRRDRDRARRMGRRRTPSEKVVDRACDRLRSDRG